MDEESYKTMNKECRSIVVELPDGHWWAVEGREQGKARGYGRTMREAYVDYLLKELKQNNLLLKEMTDTLTKQLHSLNNIYHDAHKRT